MTHYQNSEISAFIPIQSVSCPVLMWAIMFSTFKNISLHITVKIQCQCRRRPSLKFKTTVEFPEAPTKSNILISSLEFWI